MPASPTRYLPLRWLKKIFYAFLASMRATHSSYLIFLDFIIVVIFGKVKMAKLFLSVSN
jgi:hypothetical protein